jgi:AcrR family transcriptional regulator
VDACISLVEEGALRPTAPEVAERAEVSVRSVFQHFADLPALHSAVIERIAGRLEVLLAPIDTDMALEERLVDFVRHRAALLEALSPFRRAANVHAPFAPEVRDSVRVGVAYLRDEVVKAFQPELSARSDAERRELVDALVAALSWQMWDALRSESGCSIAAATAAVERIVRSLLASP